MKRKTTFLKTLLVAVGLLTGASAWADLTPYSESYSSTSTITGWSTGTSGRFTPVILNESDNYFLSVNQGERNNNGTTVTGTVLNGKAAAGDDFTLMFDMRIGSGSNQATNGNNFEIKDAAGTGNILSLIPTANNATTWKINGTTTTVTLPNSGTNTATDGTAISSITWISYKISRSGSLTYLTITNKETDEVILPRQIIESSATGGLGNILYITRRYNGNFAIDNIVLRALESGDVPAATPTTYTIQYKNEDGTKIAEDVVVNSIVGLEVSADASQTSQITYSETKYVYKSGNDPIKLVADEASNIITLTYREAAIYSYSMKAYNSSDTEIGTILSGTFVEGDAAITKGFPQYVLNGTTLYSIDHNGSGDWYRTTFTPNADAYVKKLTYNGTTTSNVIFYTEAENVEGVTKQDYTNRASNGQVAKTGSNETFKDVTTLPAGLYRIHAKGLNGNTSAKTIIFKVGETPVFNFSITNGTDQNGTSDAFFVASPSTLSFAGECASTGGLDLFYVEDVLAGAIADVKANESSAAFAAYIDGETFTSPEQVYAAHTAWQIEQAKAGSSTDVTKVILNAGVASTANWTNSRVIELASEVSNVAPDNFIIDANNQVLDTYQMIYGLPAGKYTVKAATRATAACESGKIYVYAEGQVDKNAAGNHVGNTGGDLENGWSWTSIDFELTATSDVKIGYYVDATSKWASCDDWHLTLGGVPATIGADGYATFSSAYALDFTGTGIDAYIAKKGDGSKVMMTKVTKAPANTGLFLKGATANVPVTTAATDDVTGNLLVATTGDVIAAGNYVLAKQEDNMAFYRLNAALSGVAAGKAYLSAEAASGAGAKSLSMVFEGDATGIESLRQATKEGEGQWFNLAGQRVAQPTKGLYIVNGKKVSVK